jgi:anti-sigma regulatory factor (Ser/Thr protein kinase)
LGINIIGGVGARLFFYSLKLKVVQKMVVALKWNEDKSNPNNDGDFSLEETLIGNNEDGKFLFSKEIFNGSSMEFEYIAASHAINVSKFRDKVMCAAIKAGAEGDTLDDIIIAAGEALTNAYRHGSHKEDCVIWVKCNTDFKQFIIEIADEGCEFDFDSIEDPDIYLMKDHGMGIYIMRKAMDDVCFSNEGKGSKVRMTKEIKTFGIKSSI